MNITSALTKGYENALLRSTEKTNPISSTLPNAGCIAKDARKACQQVLAIANRFFETVARINEGPLGENRGGFGGNRGIFEENRDIFGLNQGACSANNGDPDHEPKNVKQTQFPKGRNEHKLRLIKELRNEQPGRPGQNKTNLARSKTSTLSN